MPTLGEHLASAADLLADVKAELADVLVELAAARAALESATVAINSLNDKIPAAVDGKLPVGATVDVDSPIPVTTTQLPATLANGKVRVTGLL